MPDIAQLNRQLNRVSLDAYRARFERAEIQALWECVKWCEENAVEWPAWVRTALAAVAGAYLDGNKLDPLFKPWGGKGGRLSDPRTKAAATERADRVLAAVRAAEWKGFRGELKFRQADAVLRHQGIQLDLETIKQVYHRRRKVQENRNVAELSALADVVLTLLLTDDG